MKKTLPLIATALAPYFPAFTLFAALLRAVRSRIAGAPLSDGGDGLWLILPAAAAGLCAAAVVLLSKGWTTFQLGRAALLLRLGQLPAHGIAVISGVLCLLLSASAPVGRLLLCTAAAIPASGIVGTAAVTRGQKMGTITEGYAVLLILFQFLPVLGAASTVLTFRRCGRTQACYEQ